MPPLHAKSCEIHEGFLSKFSSCKGEPVGRCVYCGRAFCAQHGDIREEGQEICSRKNCVAKRDDLVVHLQYVAFVNRDNEAGACGQRGCEETPEGECGRCRGFFCARHLDTREETINRGRARVAQMATMCLHCWARRPIWTRM